ncbi:MAG: hypothetical protein IPP90_12090 [Gemmatimonadaceae bacterium]|nr:hypothetical protein [Gemmatimonadaceae bacterium]
MMRPRIGLFAGVLLAVSLAPSLSAQGTLSGLGFGYPVGGLSTRAAATGGAFGEFDLLSPLNPASLSSISRTVITAQTEPEFRTLRAGKANDKTTAQRVPLLMLAFPVRDNVSVALSATTFLDRSYSTTVTGDVVIDGSSVSTTDHSDVRGSIADLRAAAGWRINDRFSVGFGAHMFTGDNLVARSRTFADSTKFGNVLDSSRVVYFGSALSVGGEWRVRKGFAAMVSYRKGGGIDSRVRDTVRTEANIPNRLGVGVRFDGIPGSIFAVGIDQQDWSRMRALGSSAVVPRDATNWHAGMEVAGPRMRGSPLLLRAGYARNALPFGIGSNVVDESRLTAGFGIPVAREQASLDFSIQKANRTLVGGGAKESAWMLGVGLQIRP